MGFCDVLLVWCGARRDLEALYKEAGVRRNVLDACPCLALMRKFTLRNRAKLILRFDSRISASARTGVENAAQRACRALSPSKLRLSKTPYRNNDLR
jgi:hypothetical protein